MHTYTVIYAGYFSTDNQNPGWYHSLDISKNIKSTKQEKLNNLCFLEGNGVILVDNTRHYPLCLMSVSPSNIKAERFKIEHVAQQGCYKVLHVNSGQLQEDLDRNALIYISFQGDLHISFEDALSLLRIQMDDVVSRSIYSNTDEVSFLVFILRQGCYTNNLCEHKHLQNYSGKVTIEN